MSATDRPFDAIVLGVGVMGAAACMELARRGLKVLGIEQFEPGHDRGSSHGRSRVIRKAYFEDPRYVPLLHRTYALWRDLEAASGESLITRTGCLNLGPGDHSAIRGVMQSVSEHRLPHEVLSAAEIRRRWPGLECNDADVGVFEEDAGYLAAEQCTARLVEAAKEAGARIEVNLRAVEWRTGARGVVVETDRGECRSKHLVITAGAWLPVIGMELNLPLRIERQVQAWFEPRRPERFQVGRFPVFIHFVEDRAYYGIPSVDGKMMKVARHHGGMMTTADCVDRTPNRADEDDIRWYLKRHLPEADGPMVDAKICLYTNTPDENFVIDRHPHHDNVIVGGGFSGHGFKFAPVVGEIVADLVDGKTCRFDLSPFSLRRFLR